MLNPRALRTALALVTTITPHAASEMTCERVSLSQTAPSVRALGDAKWLRIEDDLPLPHASLLLDMLAQHVFNLGSNCGGLWLLKCVCILTEDGDEHIQIFFDHATELWQLVARVHVRPGEIGQHAKAV